jgi:hypothetical protein
MDGRSRGGGGGGELGTRRARGKPIGNQMCKDGKLGTDILLGVMTSSGPERVCLPQNINRVRAKYLCSFPTETCHPGRWQEAKPEHQETQLPTLSQLKKKKKKKKTPATMGTKFIRASGHYQNLATTMASGESFTFSFSIF